MKLWKTAAVPAIAALVLTAGLLLIFASFLSHYFVPHLGHNQNICLFDAQRIVAGAEPYGPLISETNPPLILWFSAIPVALAGLLNTSPVLIFKLLLFAMIFFSVAWCVRLLRCGTSISNPIAIGLLGCSILCIELSTGWMDFGEREHLLVILLLPYLLAAATRVFDRLSVAERCALGVAAGVAIWFKPQQTLVVIGIELFLALRARSLRRILAPEVVSLISTAVLLLGMVRLFAPLYMKATYPILIDTYWAFGEESPFEMALSLHFYLLYVLLAVLFCYCFRRLLRDPAATMALLTASLFASFAFDIQRNTWNYHRYPHRAFLLTAVAYMSIDLLSPSLDRLLRRRDLLRHLLLIGSVVSAVLLCAVAIRPSLGRFAHSEPDRDDVARFFSRYPPGTTVYAFSTVPFPFSTAYVHHLNWGSRFVHLWMLPAIVQNESGPAGSATHFKRLSPERLATLASIQRSESTEDLQHWKPAVVLVRHCTPEDSCMGLDGKNFDMIGWFQQSPEFASAWSHYRRQPEHLRDYDIYKLER